MISSLVPGALVRHPGQPDWGIGQVQSVAGHRVTVSFEHAGKRVIDRDVVTLEAAGAADGGGRRDERDR